MADCIKTTPEWVQLITPKRLGNRLVVVGSWVVDFDDGYGPCFGRVVGLTGRHELDVEWADGGKESIHRKNARLVPCVGSTWTHDGNKYILKRYSEKGAHLNFLGGLDALTPRRRSRRTRTSETSKAKSKTSKVKPKKRAASQDKSKNESSAAKPRRSKRKSKRRSTPSPTKSPAKKTARKGKSPAKSPAKKTARKGKSPAKSPAKKTSRKWKSRRQLSPSSKPNTRKNSDANRSAAPPRAKQKTYQWHWQDPEHAGKKHFTKVRLPGPVYDTIFKKVMYATGLSPLDSTMVMTHDEDHPQRSKCHLRCCTPQEFKEAGDLQPDATAHADSAADNDPEDVEDTTTGWARCDRYPPLPEGVSSRVGAAMTEIGYTPKEQPAYYAFIHRVARVYRGIAGPGSLHDERDRNCVAAVEVSLFIRTDV